MHAIADRYFGIDRMAKKRRVAKSERTVDLASDRSENVRTFDPFLIASGLLGSAIVYLMYHPSDAAQVESGDALWFGMLSLVIGLFTFLARPAVRVRSLDRWLDVAVWSLAIWIMFVAFANTGVGNLRMGTNEAWVWISGAAIFTAVRRLAVRQPSRKAVAGLIVVCAVGLAVHALHQQWVTLPMDRAAFQADPDRVMKAAEKAVGIDAPPKSAERYVFAGRLFDGGPTATFALANSLAAVLITGVLLSAGVVRYSFARLSPFLMAVWITIAILCATAVWATRSRSAVVACLFGAGMIWLGGGGSLIRSVLQRSRTLVGLAVAACLSGGLIWMAKPGWFSAAQASIAFRVQYWRATLRMIADRPLLGAGPGNFQAMYDRYRDEATSEQIADPHNLFFETLGSGGLVGFLLLIVCVMLAVKVVSGGKADLASAELGDETNDGRAVWMGACIALVLVWLFGFAVRQLPDVNASLFVLPIVASLGFVVMSSVRMVSSPDLDRLMLIVLLSVGMHLTFSGGWTVPGVAIVVWICAGFVTRLGVDKVDPSNRNFSGMVWGGGACLVLLGALYILSLRPVLSAERSLAIARMAIEDGRFGLAERSYRQAANSDSWSPAASLGLADLNRWKLVSNDSPDIRRQWNAGLQQSIRRGGQNPTLLRAIGIQQIHLYQRYGRTEDLNAAATTFESAVKWSPVNQWMIAQLAAIVAEQGDVDRAKELSDRAKRLSEMGINLERGFQFQLIYPAQPFGETAKTKVIRRPAPEVLSELQ